MKIIDFKIGSDPEYGVINENNKPISAVGKVGGTKSVPLTIGNGCNRQEDGVAVEFCIPPTTTKEEFLQYLNYCELKGNELLNPMGLKLCATSSFIYDDEELKSKQAQTLGCSSSYDAYTGDEQSPSIKNAGNMRTMGFHIHVGFKMPEDVCPEDIMNFIKYMDMYVGLPSILIDKDVIRRNLYGKAGDYRVRIIDEDLVIEYRSLGGSLLQSNETKGWVYDSTLIAIENFNNQTKLIPDDLLQEAINHSNINLTNQLIDEYNIKTLSSSLRVTT